MKKISFIAVIILVLGCGLFFLLRDDGNDKPAPDKQPTQEVANSAKKPVLNRFYEKPVRTPQGWDDFYDLSQMDKLSKTTPYMNNPSLVAAERLINL